MTKMASRPMYAKNLQKNSFFGTNKMMDDLETWYMYTASDTQILPNFFKWWHWDDLAHFYDMVKFVS